MSVQRAVNVGTSCAVKTQRARAGRDTLSQIANTVVSTALTLRLGLLNNIGTIYCKFFLKSASIYRSQALIL